MRVADPRFSLLFSTVEIFSNYPNCATPPPNAFSSVMHYGAWNSLLSFEIFRSTGVLIKSIVRPGRKHANVSVRMNVNFLRRPALQETKTWWQRASLTYLRACFHPGRAKDLSAPRYRDYVTELPAFCWSLHRPNITPHIASFTLILRQMPSHYTVQPHEFHLMTELSNPITVRSVLRQSIAYSKARSPYSSIYCFLVSLPVSSPFLKVIQQLLMSSSSSFRHLFPIHFLQ